MAGFYEKGLALMKKARFKQVGAVLLPSLLCASRGELFLKGYQALLDMGFKAVKTSKDKVGDGCYFLFEFLMFQRERMNLFMGLLKVAGTCRKYTEFLALARGHILFNFHIVDTVVFTLVSPQRLRACIRLTFWYGWDFETSETVTLTWPRLS